MRRRAKARLAAEVLAAYAYARWRLRRGDLPSAVAALRARADKLPRRQLHPRGPVALAHQAVRVLRPLPTDTRCLSQSLVVLALLRRRGVDAQLVLGVQPAPSFSSHAWIEFQGAEVLPAGGYRETRLTEF